MSSSFSLQAISSDNEHELRLIQRTNAFLADTPGCPQRYMSGLLSLQAILSSGGASHALACDASTILRMDRRKRGPDMYSRNT